MKGRMIGTRTETARVILLEKGGRGGFKPLYIWIYGGGGSALPCLRLDYRSYALID